MSSKGPKAQRLERLADALVTKALAGDVTAIREIGDRMDGKPAQSIAVGQDPELEAIKVEAIVRPQITREAWLKLHGEPND